jgi:hypothetical protein
MLSHAARMAKDRKERIKASDKAEAHAAQADHKRVQGRTNAREFFEKFSLFPRPGV